MEALVILNTLLLVTILFTKGNRQPKQQKRLEESSFHPIDISQIQLRQDEQIARLEKKIDLLLKELGVEKEVRAKTECEVILEVVPRDKKIAVLKAVRLLTGMGLKEAKNLVESTPAVIKRKITENEAEKIATELRNAGATVSID